MTLYFRRCRGVDGVYQLTQRERALEVHRMLTQALEDERQSLSSQSLRVSDSYESRVPRPSVPFRRAIRRPNLRVVRRQPESSQIPPAFPSLIPLEDPQSPTPDSPDEISSGSPITTLQQRRRLFSYSGSPPNCFPPRDVSSTSAVNAAENHGALSPSLNQMIIDEIFGSWGCDPTVADDIIDESISIGTENEYAFGNLFDTIANDEFFAD